VRQMKFLQYWLEKFGFSALFALTGTVLAPSLAAAQDFVLRVAGPEQVVAPVEAFHCGSVENPDFPDSPLHAYRAADGTVRVFALNQSNFPLVADSGLAQISHPSCNSMFASPHKDDPALFADRIWLNGPHTLDGTHVVAITHMEYHGMLHQPYSGTCSAKGGDGVLKQTCWYSATGLVKSSDGGNSFVSAGLVAALPYKFDVSMTRAGISNASNVLRNPQDGSYYVFVHAFGYGAQDTGECVLQSADLQHWKAWDGKAFSVSFVNPYELKEMPAAHICAPVFKAGIFFTVVYSRTLNVFLATAREGKFGFHCVSSPDLIHWTPQALSRRTAFFGGFYPENWSPERTRAALYPSQWPTGDDMPSMYPSLLDPTSTDRNFSTIGDHPYLYFVRAQTRVRGDGTAVPDNAHREIVRVPLRVVKS
jgi:hypothetical protein